MVIGKITMAIALTVIMALSHIAANAQRFRVLSHHERDSIIALLPKMPDNEEKLGNLYTISRNHEMMDSIIYYSMKAYHLAKQLGNTDYVAATCVVIGWYYNTIGKYAIAPKYFNEAGDIYESRKDSKGQAMMLSCCGDSYIGMRKFEQGLSYKLKALSIFAYTDDLASAAQIYRTIGMSCTQFQQYKSALEYLDKALNNDTIANNKQGIERDYYYIALT
ncbi:MAG: tetratricopeptide repeat protein, partial [Bacteroidales bacterium]|nr:tetratricopeptide repeat protein [Bacteroidales bacterium]